MIIKTDALIVGGGPAGATAARFLAGAGIDTVLAERDLSYVKPCGGGIPSGGFHELELPEKLIKKKIDQITINSPKGRKVEISLRGGQIFMTERGILDSALRDMAIQAGASLIEGQFIGLEKSGNTYISSVSRKIDAEKIQIISEYVLASDGISFCVGRHCGIKNNPRLYAINVHIRPFSGNACEFWFGTAHASHFYSWVFPSDGWASVGTGGTNPLELYSLLDKFMLRRFGSSLKALQGKKFLGRPRIFPLPVWKNKAFRTGNIFFLGDAAGMVMPVTYEGIYYAMKSGQFAAQAIINKNPAMYQQLWENRFRRRFAIMNKIKDHFFKSNDTIEKWITVHESAATQALAMRLWLQKESGSPHLSSYLKAFGSLFSM